MNTLVCKNNIPYDGTQLAPHWIYTHYDLLGDAIVAFTGPANVALRHMVDLEDVKKKAPIYSPLMLHFIGEFFIDSLDTGILLQHLFMNNTYELLLEKGILASRRGNDIFFEGRKLSVSIATKSLISCLFHAGLNIETQGTPVPTAGLKELKQEPIAFAQEVLERFTRDFDGWKKARVKVTARAGGPEANRDNT